MMVGTSCRITIRTMISMPVRPRSEHAGQATGLALQVKAQRQFVHVHEGEVR